MDLQACYVNTSNTSLMHPTLHKNQINANVKYLHSFAMYTVFNVLNYLASNVKDIIGISKNMHIINNDEKNHRLEYKIKYN